MPQPPPPTAEVIARVRQRLADRIDATGITIARLSRRSGVSKTTIHRLLRDGEDGDIYLGTLVNLARVLLVDVRDLLDPLPDESEHSVRESTLSGHRQDGDPEGDSN